MTAQTVLFDGIPVLVPAGLMVGFAAYECLPHIRKEVRRLQKDLAEVLVKGTRRVAAALDAVLKVAILTLVTAPPVYYLLHFVNELSFYLGGAHA